MDNNENEFDQLRNLMNDAEMAPSNDLWDKIEQKMDKPSNKLGLWGMSFLGFALVGVLGCVFYKIANNQNVNVVSKQKNSVATKNISAINVDNQAKSTVKKNDVVNSKMSVLAENEGSKNSISPERNEISNDAKSEEANFKTERNAVFKEISSTEIPPKKLSFHKKIKKENDIKISKNKFLLSENAEQKFNNKVNFKLNKTKTNEVNISKLEKEIFNLNLYQVASIEAQKIPFNVDSINLNEYEKNKKAFTRKKKLRVVQKSYDVISSVSYFYNNRYKPEDNMLVNNSYKLGFLVNYYFSPNVGLGVGFVNSSVFYNTVVLERQRQNVNYVNINEEVKNINGTEVSVFNKTDTTIVQEKDVNNTKTSKIKSVYIPVQFLYKFNITSRLSFENRMGIAGIFSTSSNQNLTRPIGFSYQHNLNFHYALTPQLKVFTGPEYSFYFNDLVQNHSGWFPMGFQIGARLNFN